MRYNVEFCIIPLDRRCIQVMSTPTRVCNQTYQATHGRRRNGACLSFFPVVSYHQ